MRKTNANFEAIDPKDMKAVNTEGLQAMLGAGRQTATEIGMAAGARMQIGRRVLWNVAKIQSYLDEISE